MEQGLARPCAERCVDLGYGFAIGILLHINHVQF